MSTTTTTTTTTRTCDNMEDYIPKDGYSVSRLLTGRCWVVGIAGPSGCGKSTLSFNLVQSLHTVMGSDVKATIFPEDPKYFRAPKSSSYRDANPLSETPSFTDWDQYVADLENCLGKGTTNLQTERNVARMASNEKCDDTIGGCDDITARSTGSTPTTFLWIVDHFLLLQHPRVVKLLDMLIFLDPCIECADDLMETKEESSLTTIPSTYLPPMTATPLSTLSARNLCRERRIQRDPHRSPEEQEYLRQYYDRYVWPAYLHYTHGPARRLLRQNEEGGGRRQQSKSSTITILRRTLQIDCSAAALDPSEEYVLQRALTFVVSHILQPQTIS